jgi:NADH dehydrogenase/NADH:ubiquinone oxidoreductase subunit G
LPSQGFCGVCAVETTNKAEKTAVCNARVTKAAVGLKVNTQAAPAIAAVKKQLQSLIIVHDERCSTCVANERCEVRSLVFGAQAANPKTSPFIPNSINVSTLTVQIDLSKCAACAQCVHVCKNISGQKTESCLQSWPADRPGNRRSTSCD